MPTVTALRAVRTARVAVELDGAPWRTIPLEVALRAGLGIGVELDRSRARILRRELRRTEALRHAARALRSRERTSAELDHRLARSGVRRRERADAIDTLERAGVVDDARAAARRADSLVERGWGDAAIRWQLERRGVARDLVEEAIAALPPERERAERLAAGAGGGRRAALLLGRRGFDPHTVEDVLGLQAGADTA